MIDMTMYLSLGILNFLYSSGHMMISKLVLELPSDQLTPPSSCTHKLTRMIANGDRISDMIVDIDCALFNVGVGPPRTCEGLDEKSSFAVGYDVSLRVLYVQLVHAEKLWEIKYLLCVPYPSSALLCSQFGLSSTSAVSDIVTVCCNSIWGGYW